jgi:predicted phage terminase large subunit-like protein
MTKQEARDLCKTDPFFLAEKLGYDFNQSKDVHGALFSTFPKPDESKAIRDWSERKNLLILWPRGHMKTSATVVHIVQVILNCPDVRIVLMQGNLNLTKKWLSEVKSHFDGSNPQSRLPELFPQFAPETNRANNQFEFTVGARTRKHLKEATVTAASPKAISTGQHYDYFFADDLVHTGNFRNIELLDKLENEFSHFVPLIDPGGYTTVTGTRYHHADIYGRIIRRNQGEWHVSVKGCFDGEKSDVNPDGLLFPERLTKDGSRKVGFTKALLDQIARDDIETFNAQYLNRIIPTKQHLFPEPLLMAAVRASKDPSFPSTAPTVLAVDLATGQKADSDHSVIAAGKLGASGIWVTDCVGGVFSPFSLVTVLMQMALKHRPHIILVEKAVGAEFFVEYARMTAQEKGINLRMNLHKVSQQKGAKYLRIAAVEKWLRTGKMFFCAGIADFEKLVEEFSQFPKGRHDDRPDAISMLVEYFQQGYVAPAQTNNLSWLLKPQAEKPSDSPTDNPLGFGFNC